MQLGSLHNSPRLVERLWDLWCVVSVIGIWPRFIEPRLLFTSKVQIPLPNLPRELEGLKVLQISDLHYSSHTSERFLERVLARIKKLSPDLIVFTGDIISYSTLPESDALERFLKGLEAPLGTYFIYGNHDYAEYVSLGKDGRFRKIESHMPVILRGFARLFAIKEGKDEGPLLTEPLEEHTALKALLSRSGVRVLHNETVQVGSRAGQINLTGLGDYMAGQCRPFDAFSDYDPRLPGIVLSHNPDSYQSLENFPGELFLFGHTHGGQVNLPYIWKRITPIKNEELKSGLFHLREHDEERFLYVNRGLGATFPFRWFSPPEITLFTLTRQGLVKNPVWQRLFPQESTQEPVLGAP